jgi:hypothetical protein
MGRGMVGNLSRNVGIGGRVSEWQSKDVELRVYDACRESVAALVDECASEGVGIQVSKGVTMWSGCISSMTIFSK